MEVYPREFDYSPNIIDVNSNQDIVCEGDTVFITVYVEGIPDFNQNDYKPNRFESIQEFNIKKFREE